MYTLKPRPLDPLWRHPVTTPQARLDTLVDAARCMLDGKADGLALDGLAAALACTEAEARDVVQALGKSVAWFWPGKGWRVRLRSPAEVRLVAANDNSPQRRVWEGAA